jgi:hypothetical protein
MLSSTRAGVDCAITVSVVREFEARPFKVGKGDAVLFTRIRRI